MTDVTLGSLTAAGTLPAGAAVLVRQPSSAGASTYVLGAVNVSALYALPTASSSVLGGIKIGTGLTIDQTGTVSATSTGGVSTFNTRTGAVTLTLGDVTGVTGTGATARSNLGLAAVAASGLAADLTGSLPLANLSSGGGSNGQGLVLSGGVWTPTTLANGTTYTGSAPISVSGSVVSLSGIVPIANGGTGTTTPGLIAGTNVTVSGSWPNQTVNASSGGYTLPTATTTILGGVKVDGSSIVISNGVISASASGAFAPTSVLRTFDNGAVVSAGTLYFIGSSPWAGNILSLDSKCGTGSYSVAIQINGVTVTGLSAVNVSGSTSTNTAATAAYSFPAGAVITAVVSAPAGSPTDSFLNLRIQRTA